MYYKVCIMKCEDLFLWMFVQWDFQLRGKDLFLWMFVQWDFQLRGEDLFLWMFVQWDFQLRALVFSMDVYTIEGTSCSGPAIQNSWNFSMVYSGLPLIRHPWDQSECPD